MQISILVLDYWQSVFLSKFSRAMRNDALM